MKRWRKTLVVEDATIQQAIETIDASGLQVALVVDAEDRLRGVVTDGDVRRGILRGLPLHSPVSEIMNARPTTVRPDEDEEVVRDLMRQHKVHQIPVVEEGGRVVGLEVVDELLDPPCRPNLVVLMAGGLGTRLRPLTDDRPKPLLEVGKKPILESILENFIAHGFRDFALAVNYKGEMIEDHFGDGSEWDVRIRYIREKERMGTAGALSLLGEVPEDPVVVMNGDLLTKINLKHMLDFHDAHDAMATMGVREYHFEVPYGVIETEEFRVLAIREKPVHRFLVNAGVYVLDPRAFHYIPDHFFDMPDLFNALSEDGHTAAVFPIREYWLDIGRLEDFEKANRYLQGGP